MYMLIVAALFVIVECQKSPECPYIGNWWNKCGIAMWWTIEQLLKNQNKTIRQIRKKKSAVTIELSMFFVLWITLEEKKASEKPHLILSFWDKTLSKWEQLETLWGYTKMRLLMMKVFPAMKLFIICGVTQFATINQGNERCRRGHSPFRT